MKRLSLSWFIEQIGKRVLPTSSLCKCNDCKRRLSQGLLIENEHDANYLFRLHIEHGIGYTPLPYPPSTSTIQ